MDSLLQARKDAPCRVVLTARGQVFVAPVKPGRFVEATHDNSVRYREAQFMPDGKSLLAISDSSGELEFCQIPANGVGQPVTLTKAGQGFRFGGTPSPDGKWIAYADKDYRLWVFNVADKKSKQIDQSQSDTISGMAWSPDSQWLAYVRVADNTFSQIWLYSLKSATATALTTDRVNSYNPVWQPNGKWIYFLSDRHLKSVVDSPWGPREPEPFFDQLTEIYQAALLPDLRSPFAAPDELTPAREDDKKDKDSTNAVVVKIDLAGIQQRLQRVPVSPGNYSQLDMSDESLYVMEDKPASTEATKGTLKSLALSNDDPKFKNVAEDVKSFELAADHKHLLIRKDDDFYVVPADTAPAKLEKSVALGSWSFPLNPRDEWRQMFTEAWRLERDYFYDRHMNGVDWPGMLQKYLPLVDRVTDRDELNDLLSEAIGELSALHMFVIGGDLRPPPDQAGVAALGAVLELNSAGDGYQVKHIYQSDPDYPEKLSPLARPGVKVQEGDLIQAVNGTPISPAAPIGDLLRNQAGVQVLLHVKPAHGAARDVVVTPVSADGEAELRYGEWEYARRLETEKLGGGEIGYVHLRAMGQADIAQWTRDFYPIFNRSGLILDVRHNRGGNIDSWILEKLMRKAWFFWQGRTGAPYWNMQYAFRGHVVVLCDEDTASDGEAFTEGFKRLGLGKTIGTRTWGGEIWLSEDNGLVDQGMATAAEYGVYGPEGKWLIEGHGVDPDITVDNLPHATFEGEDAQLKKAVDYLKEEIKREPVVVPPAPPYPDKSLK
jgi:tricorn protease